MKSLRVVLDAEEAGKLGIRLETFFAHQNTYPHEDSVKDGIEVAGMPRGTDGGKPTVFVGVPLPDGGGVLAETTLALFLSAADALKAHYGDPR